MEAVSESLAVIGQTIKFVGSHAMLTEAIESEFIDAIDLGRGDGVATGPGLYRSVPC